MIIFLPAPDYNPDNGGTVTIESGSQLGCFMVSLEEDSLAEGTESFTISFPVVSGLSDITVDIVDGNG